MHCRWTARTLSEVTPDGADGRVRVPADLDAVTAVGAEEHSTEFDKASVERIWQAVRHWYEAGMHPGLVPVPHGLPDALNGGLVELSRVLLCAYRRHGVQVGRDADPAVCAVWCHLREGTCRPPAVHLAWSYGHAFPLC